MTFDFLAMKTTSLAERRAQKEAEKEAERQKAEAIEQVSDVLSPNSMKFMKAAVHL